MVVGEMASHEDIVIIGGGPGGYTAALGAAGAGRRVTLVERDAIGGTCLNVGCIPSKALIHISDVAALRESASPWGLDVHVDVDMTRVQSWVERVVGRLRGGVTNALQAAGVTVVNGEARFTSPRRVAIQTGGAVEHIEFDQAVVATGSRPATLAALPVDRERVVDSTGALSLRRIPATVAVVGAGYIGLELGTALAKLGAAVTIVEAAGTILPGVPPSLVGPVKRRLHELGVRVEVQAALEGVQGDDLIVTRPDGATRVPAELIVVAVGRRPNTDALGLDAAGVQVVDGLISVDAARRAKRNLLAIGDVTRGPPVAHKAMAEAEVAAATIAGRPRAFDPAVIPLVIYTDPEIVTVGATLEAAQAEQADAQRVMVPVSTSGRALTLGSTDGHAELILGGDGAILGAHLVGPRMSELAGEVALAVEMGARAEDLALTTHPHPTISELLGDAARRFVPAASDSRG